MPPKKSKIAGASLQDVLAKQGYEVSVQTKKSEGGVKMKESSWLSDVEEDASAKPSVLSKSVKDMQKDGDFMGSAKIGGNYDRFGIVRRNVGGGRRP